MMVRKVKSSSYKAIDNRSLAAQCRKIYYIIKTITKDIIWFYLSSDSDAADEDRLRVCCKYKMPTHVVTYLRKIPFDSRVTAA